ncbi:hypothetical protein B296_00017883 [Ensete ventricosum]|uniref:Uncharacterized protein n=1 Tax=Ensete ventricosum TaxID=4639 RepID=A0A426ZRK4_ENSVE|nr:hypothetical protein B296_00017883 [Ensete ventricosum]
MSSSISSLEREIENLGRSDSAGLARAALFSTAGDGDPPKMMLNFCRNPGPPSPSPQVPRPPVLGLLRRGRRRGDHEVHPVRRLPEVNQELLPHLIEPRVVTARWVPRGRPLRRRNSGLALAARVYEGDEPLASPRLEQGAGWRPGGSLGRDHRCRLLGGDRIRFSRGRDTASEERRRGVAK